MLLAGRLSAMAWHRALSMTWQSQRDHPSVLPSPHVHPPAPPRKGASNHNSGVMGLQIEHVSPALLGVGSEMEQVQGDWTSPRHHPLDNTEGAGGTEVTSQGAGETPGPLLLSQQHVKGPRSWNS